MELLALYGTTQVYCVRHVHLDNFVLGLNINAHVRRIILIQHVYACFVHVKKAMYLISSPHPLSGYRVPVGRGIIFAFYAILDLLPCLCNNNFINKLMACSLN